MLCQAAFDMNKHAGLKSHRRGVFKSKTGERERGTACRTTNLLHDFPRVRPISLANALPSQLLGNAKLFGSAGVETWQLLCPCAHQAEGCARSEQRE